MVIEHALHQGLAIIKRAIDGNRVHIRLGRRRHHAPLHIRHAALRVEDNDIDPLRAAKRFDRRPAGIARGRADDGRAFAALVEYVIHHPRKQLHGDVFEGECRPVKQFEHPCVTVDLHQWGDRWMTKRCIRSLRHGGQIGARDRATGERCDHLHRNLMKRPASKSCDRRFRQLGPSRRHKEAAIAGQTCEQHIFELEGRREAARRYVFQERNLA